MPGDPLQLGDLARRLEIHPFELVGILEARGGLPERLLFDEADLDAIEQASRLERWWEGEADRPDDPTDREGWIRALARRLRDHALSGPTRLDNLLRGLPPEARATVRAIVARLLDAGWLVARHQAIGTLVEVSGQHREAIVALAGEGPLPPLLAGQTAP